MTRFSHGENVIHAEDRFGSSERAHPAGRHVSAMGSAALDNISDFPLRPAVAALARTEVYVDDAEECLRDILTSEIQGLTEQDLLKIMAFMRTEGIKPEGRNA